jgi:hypothetical protein
LIELEGLTKRKGRRKERREEGRRGRKRGKPALQDPRHPAPHPCDESALPLPAAFQGEKQRLLLDFKNK